MLSFTFELFIEISFRYFDQLTSEEQNLWTKFETGDIYRFLTGEEDTVPEFQYNWRSVPKLQPLESTTTTTAPAPTTAPPVAPPQLPSAPASPPDIGQSPSTPSSTPHSSPTPSTTGTRPKQTAPAPTKPQQPDPSGASTSGTTLTSPSTTRTHNLRQRQKVDYKELNTGAAQFGRDQFRKRCSQAGASVRKSVAKVRKMSQIPTDFQKILILFYSHKMTTGCHTLASEPENTNTTIKSIFTNNSNYTQCFNIPSGHRFAFKIHQPLKQLNLTISNKFMASIIEEHFYYADQYATIIEKKIEKMEFSNMKWIQLYLVKNLKQNCGRILTALVLLAIIRKLIGYKNLIALFAIHLIQPAQAKKPTTLQGLHNTLLYIRFRINYNWLSSGFGEQQWKQLSSTPSSNYNKLQHHPHQNQPQLLKYQCSR
jgi:hypothetical protein